MEHSGNDPSERLRAGEPITIAGLLASAVSMEDQISSGVYEDYMTRAHWPKELEEAAFLEICKRLTVLIQDTRRHRQIIQTLIQEYGQDKLAK